MGVKHPLACRADGLSEGRTALGSGCRPGLSGAPAVSAGGASSPAPSVHPLVLLLCPFVRSARRPRLVPTLPGPLAVVDMVDSTEGPVPAFYGAWSSEEDGPLSDRHRTACNSRLLKGL